MSRQLVPAAAEFARGRGARAVEGYPIDSRSGHAIIDSELHVGSESIFAAAGFRVVIRPTSRRLVMRRDFA